MAYLRPLGRTGLLVSPIGLGTVKFGRNEKLKYPFPFDLPSDEQIASLLRCALDVGVNVLDTAPAYGTSEERIGSLLPGRRDDWILITKCGESFSRGRSTWDFSPEATVRSVENSLRLLRTDHLDVVLVHSDGRDREIIEVLGTLDALADLKARGLIHAAGISTKSAEGGLAALGKCDVVMITLNLQEQAEAVVAQAAAKAGSGVLVKKALLSGRLDEAAGRGDPVQRCLEFVLGTPGVHCAVIGTLSAAHLRGAAETARRILAPRGAKG